MKSSLSLRFSRSTAVSVLFSAFALAGTAQGVLFSNFNESGTTVNGYQDDFDGASLNPDWLEFDGNGDDGTLFALTGNGSLTMFPANGDPNKLLYNPATPYNSTVQEVVALIRVEIDSPGDTDGFRGGVTTTSDTFTGQGFNLHFREPGQPGGSPFNNHFNLLNDQVAWGPFSAGDDWTVGNYKWLRIRRELNGDGFNDVFGKVWDAGTSPEPAAWSITWDHDNFRAGLAGLATNSISGQGQFEVDYILIKADDLPSIDVVPEPSSALLLGLAVTILGGRGRRRS
ncbi:MAG: PEP-CTERM sorting domain-containing protein [Verrucomicrobiales bacterium]